MTLKRQYFKGAAVSKTSYGRRPSAPLPHPCHVVGGGTPREDGCGGAGQMWGGDAFDHSAKRHMVETRPCAPVTPTVEAVTG